MGAARGKRKVESIDLTDEQGDENEFTSPQTPHPPKQARAGDVTSSSPRYPLGSQVGGSSVYQTPPATSRRGRNVSSSSQVPSLTQSPASTFYFNDDEEVEDEGNEDYGDLSLYGTIASMYTCSASGDDRIAYA